MSFKLTIGKTCITKVPLTTNEAIMAFYPKKGVLIDSIFLSYALSALKWKGNRAVKGTTLNKKVISERVIDLPPLPLQEQFSSKVKSIEAIKMDYEAQLHDAETLMAERMQYYFS